MTRSFVHLRRMSALSVAITLFAASIASAQSPEAAQLGAAPTNMTLLSPTAFARLVQPPPVVAPAPVVKNTPRLDLFRQRTAAMAREAQATAAKAQQRKSWASRHKVVVWVLIGLAGFFAWEAVVVSHE